MTQLSSNPTLDELECLKAVLEYTMNGFVPADELMQLDKLREEVNGVE